MLKSISEVSHSGQKEQLSAKDKVVPDCDSSRLYKVVGRLI